MNPSNLLGPSSSINTVNPQTGANFLVPNFNSSTLQNNNSPNINQGQNMNGITINNYNSSLGVQSVYIPPKTVNHNRNIVALIFIISLFILAILVFWIINRSSNRVNSKKH